LSIVKQNETNGTVLKKENYCLISFKNQVKICAFRQIDLLLYNIRSLRKVKKDAHIFCYCDESYIGLLQKIYSQLGINFERVCLWIKNNQNATPQVAFNKAYEPCVYGTIGRVHRLYHVLLEIIIKASSLLPSDETSYLLFSSVSLAIYLLVNILSNRRGSP